MLAQHRSEIVEVARAHKVERLRIFGSVARGEDVSGSDLDLLVGPSEDADIYDLAELADVLESITGIRVDLVSEGGLRAGSPIEDEAVAL